MTKTSLTFFRTLYVFVVVCYESMALQKNVRVKVPKFIESGKDAVIQCNFDMDGEKLYQVKWYRNTTEFYRYTPSSREPIQIYPIGGLNVDERQSKPTKIFLKDVTRETSGLFACEVTAEQSFFTDMGTEHLEVVDLPVRHPYISGLRKRYIVNETLLVNCTSEYSYPAANITWSINGAPHSGPTVSPTHIISDLQYLTAYSTLRLLITPKYLQNSPVMTLTCTATLYNIYEHSVNRTTNLYEFRRKVRNRTNRKQWKQNQVETTTAAESQLEVPEVHDFYDDLGEDIEYRYPNLPWPWSSKATTTFCQHQLLSIVFTVILVWSIIILR